jgi:hypothetical protein
MTGFSHRPRSYDPSSLSSAYTGKHDGAMKRIGQLMLAVEVDDRHSSVSHRNPPIEKTESPFLIPQELRVAKTGIDEVDDDLVTGQLTKGMNIQHVDGYGRDDVFDVASQE